MMEPTSQSWMCPLPSLNSVFEWPSAEGNTIEEEARRQVRLVTFLHTHGSPNLEEQGCGFNWT